VYLQPNVYVNKHTDLSCFALFYCCIKNYFLTINQLLLSFPVPLLPLPLPLPLVPPPVPSSSRPCSLCPRYRVVRREARHGGQCAGETSQVQPCPVYECPNWTLPGTKFPNKLFYNIFGGIFFVLYSTLLYLPTLRFLCADGCWDRTHDRCN
jgi:hypothetical protein